MEGGGENTPMQVSVKDLMNNNRFETKKEQTGGGRIERVEDDELSLGLSMNGKFGVDIKWRGGGASNLARFSSSIPDLIDFPVLNQGRTTCGGDSKEVVSMMSTDRVGLMRSSSLPVEGVEEWKKRKALQTLRRMEAKRKRREKQKIMRACRESSYNRDRNSCLEDSAAKAMEKSVVQSNLKTQLKGENKNGFVGGAPVAVVGGGQAVPISLPPIPKQRSLSPQGGGGRGSSNGSFGVGQLESPAIRGVNKFTDVWSPPNPMVEQNVQRAPADFGSKIARSSSLNGDGTEHPSVERMVSDNQKKEEANSRMFDMPYVSTTGDGPNGKRVEGFLCQYKNSEEVRIVCVCHGDCLTPAEFVKHGGGGDVAYPLKHIVVTTTSFA